MRFAVYLLASVALFSHLSAHAQEGGGDDYSKGLSESQKNILKGVASDHALAAVRGQGPASPPDMSGLDPFSVASTGCEPGSGTEGDCSEMKADAKSNFTKVYGTDEMDQVQVFPRYRGMDSGMTEIATEHLKETLKTGFTKQYTIIGYTDPVIAASASYVRSEASQGALHNIAAAQTMGMMSDKGDSYALAYRMRQGCIHERLKDFKGDVGLAASSCDADEVKAPPEATKDKFKGKIFLPKDLDEVKHSKDSKEPDGAGSKSAFFGGSQPLSRNAFVQKASMRSEVLGFAGEEPQVYERAGVISKQEGGPGAGDADKSVVEHVFKKLEESAQGDDKDLIKELKEKFLELFGDVKFTVKVQTSFGQVFPKVEIKQDASKVKVSPRMIFQGQHQAAWTDLLKLVKEACDEKVQGGEGGGNVLGQRQKAKPFFQRKFKREGNKDMVADLSVEGVSINPTTWDLLFWMATQGRTWDRLEETCSNVGNLKLKDFREKEFKSDSSTQGGDKNVDMQRAYFWYTAFVAGGKTYEVYDKMYRLLVRAALAQHPNTEAHTNTIILIKLVEQRIGMSIPQLRQKNDEVSNNMAAFLHRLRRYRQGAYTSAFVPSSANSQRGGVDQLASGGDSGAAKGDKGAQ